jgi:hypothetical protein
VRDDALGAGIGVRAHDDEHIDVGIQRRRHHNRLGVAANQNRRGVEPVGERVAEQRAAVPVVHDELRRARRTRARNHRIDLVGQLGAEQLVIAAAAPRGRPHLGRIAHRGGQSFHVADDVDGESPLIHQRLELGARGPPFGDTVVRLRRCGVAGRRLLRSRLLLRLLRENGEQEERAHRSTIRSIASSRYPICRASDVVSR